MARIRTIKPEFPQSESVGKLSRDARLLYIMLWTIVDDEGRARAASRMLASLLYPYDDDAFGLMEGWMDELERADKVRRYEVDGSKYLEIVKWLEHQKIDKPSKSRLPPFVEGSRTVAKVLEASATDLGPSILDLGPSTVDLSEAKASAANGTFEGSDEDQFWSLADQAAKTGIARSRLGQLLKFSDGDFRAALSILKSTLRKKEPAAYLGKALAGMRDETKLDAAIEARDPAIPEFVHNAKAQGMSVRRCGDNWEIGRETFNAEGRMVGF